MTSAAVVINIHYHGATVRLPDGTLAAISAPEFAANRATYTAAYQKKTPLDLIVTRHGRHASAALVTGDPPATDPPTTIPGFASANPGGIGGPCRPDLNQGPDLFEQQIGAYLKSTEEWAPADRPDPAQRHFIRKKRRAAFFEARNNPT